MGKKSIRFKNIYDNHESMKFFACFYCGEAADTIDHFPPVSRRHDASIFDRDIQKLLIRSCSSCNSYLGSSLQSTLEQRKKFALKRFKKIPISIGDAFDHKKCIRKFFNESFRPQRLSRI